MTSPFSPISLEILWSRLIGLLDEAGTTLYRTAFSTTVRESQDYSVVVSGLNGDVIAQTTLGVPTFLGVMKPTLQYYLKRFPHDQWQPGDIVISNMPWHTYGHLPDVTMASPVFVKGKLVGFIGSFAHVPDIGGMAYTLKTKDLFEEGLVLPPVKLFKAGRPNKELIDLITSNVRLPEATMGDIYAQVTAGSIAQQRLGQLLRDEGLDDLEALGAEVHRRSEAAVRSAIATLPKGSYHYEFDVEGLPVAVRIVSTVTIKGDSLDLDYAGTSEQAPYPFNSVMQYTWGHSAYALKCALDPHNPNNEGAMRPFTVRAPEGCILNPRFPAPVYGRHYVGHYCQAAVFGALAQVAPDRVIADSGSPSVSSYFGGVDREGKTFIFRNVLAGGMGARPNKDGLPATYFPSNAAFAGVEMIENVAPLRLWRREKVVGSGGGGTFRGGDGQRLIFESLSDKPVTVVMGGGRRKNPAQGRLGGHPGKLARVYIEGGQEQPSNQTFTIERGQRLVVETAGAGGFGPPKKRDPKLLARDIANGYIVEAAASPDREPLSQFPPPRRGREKVGVKAQVSNLIPEPPGHSLGVR